MFMKNVEKCCEFAFDGFDGGINCFDNGVNNDERCLASGRNVWFVDGALKSRDGVLSKNVATLCESGETLKSIKSASGMLNKSTIALKLYNAVVDGGGYYSLKCVLATSGSVVRCIELQRVYLSKYDGEIDLRCVYFTGNAIKGCGVFGLFSVVDDEGEVVDVKVFEMNEAMNGFYVLSKSEMYAPLVLVNGKRNKFYTLEKTDRNYPKGSRFEDYNLLGGAFRAAYKTDGVSESFYLPFSKISNNSGDVIEVKYVNAAGREYSFKINPGASASSSVSVDGVNVCANINRSNGRLFFSSGSSAYALPFVEDVYNNLTVKAYMAQTDYRLFKMTQSDSFAAHAFLFGSEDERNRLYWSDETRPLYFAMSANVNVGSEIESVTACAKQNNLFLIFKEHEIYYISGVEAKRYDETMVLGGNIKSFGSKDSVTLHMMNAKIGTIYADSIQLCANRLVFLGTDNKIYALTSTAMSQKQVYVISKHISPLIDLTDKTRVFALCYKNHYLLFFGKSVLLFDYDTKAFLNVSSNLGECAAGKSIAWYYWSLDNVLGRVFGGVCCGDKCVALSSYNDSNNSLSVIMTNRIVGNNDEVVYNVGGEKRDDIVKIESEFESVWTDFGANYEKRIDELLIDISLDDFSGDIQFVTERSSSEAVPFDLLKRSDFGRVRAVVGMNFVRNFKFKIIAFGSFDVKKCFVKYKKQGR